MKYVLTFEHRRNPKNFGFYSLLLLFTLIYFLVVISFLKSILLFQAAAFIASLTPVVRRAVITSPISKTRI